MVRGTKSRIFVPGGKGLNPEIEARTGRELMRFCDWSEGERLSWINKAAHIVLFQQCFITGL